MIFRLSIYLLLLFSKPQVPSAPPRTKLYRSRSVSTLNNGNNHLNFEKMWTSPSISQETVNSITSVLSKGGLISEGIFSYGSIMNEITILSFST